MKKIKEIWSEMLQNWYFKFVWRLILMMIIFSLCRLAYFLCNHDIYAGMTFWHLTYLMKAGLIFDLSGVLYTNVFFIVLSILPMPPKIRFSKPYQITNRVFYFATNAIAIIANCGDIVYGRFTTQRTTFDFFKEFQNESQMGAILKDGILGYFYVPLIAVFLIFLMICFYGKDAKKEGIVFKKWYFYYPVNLIGMAMSVGLFIAGVRGGFMHSTRPIAPSNATEYTTESKEIPLILNTPFSVYRTIERTRLTHQFFFKEEKELNDIYYPVHYPKPDHEFHYDNVVVLILESFGVSHWGFFNQDVDNGNYKGYTPFLDSIAANSLTFKYSYANGMKSIDAMPAILSSIPRNEDPYILSVYFNNNTNSLPSLLKEKGYNTAFFHGAPNGSMGFLAYANKIGMNRYYGMKEYANDKDYNRAWGIHDEEFLQFAAHVIDTMQKPFMMSLFTLSSHHPFVIPARYDSVFKEGPNKFCRCIQYSDYALRRFFDAIKDKPWFKNTLFVITADHTNGAEFPIYETTNGKFRVPILFYKPDGSLKNYNKNDVIQQMDIMPSVLGYLGYDKPYFAYGFDIFHEKDRFAANNYNGIYQVIFDKKTYLFDGSKTLGFYDLENDIFMKNNLDGKYPEIEKKYEDRMKAFIQQYNNRLIEDRMLPEKK